MRGLRGRGVCRIVPALSAEEPPPPGGSFACEGSLGLLPGGSIFAKLALRADQVLAAPRCPVDAAGGHDALSGADHGALAARARLDVTFRAGASASGGSLCSE